PAHALLGVTRSLMQATLVRMAKVRGAVSVARRYGVVPRLEAWELPEGPVPQSVPHDHAAEHLRRLLDTWAKSSGRDVLVARDLAVRWLEERPSIGIDPDVCVVEPAPPDAARLSSLCLWKSGHHAPALSVEVVSASHPYKDYVSIQDRYAALGARELVVFDPLLLGPPSLGGPVPLQLWRADESGALVLVHFGSDPVFSETLEAWLVPSDGRLEISDDRSGERRWLTGEERERSEKERERSEKERERSEKEQERARREDLERRVAELEAKARG
ncbi:MAG TPA: Uma2 family endonuclease, partial [Polyangiaceae bacterium]